MVGGGLVYGVDEPREDAVVIGREQELTRTFVELADSLVSDYDVADLLHGLVEHSVSLLDVAAAGLLLSDQHGSLQVMASSTERTRLLELFQLQADQGPCLDCFRAGEPVAAPDLTVEAGRWPRFVQAAQQEGYAAVHAVPLRLRAEVIGAMNLFTTVPGELDPADLQVAQALADVATISILQERAIHHREVLTEQLQGALNSRIVIEQAKGRLAESANLGMDEAFHRLRGYARSRNMGLVRLARDLVDGKIEPAAILTGQPQHT